MSAERELVSQEQLLTIIEEFVSASPGLGIKRVSEQELRILQKGDSREMKILRKDLSDVLTRKDTEGKTFVQVNFVTGTKILLTDQLVGFKPQPNGDLDLTKLPKVVTTLDLMSVFEAIEESVTGAAPNEETEVLKKVFNSILLGAETVGFDLSKERTWLKRLAPTTTKASA